MVKDLPANAGDQEMQVQALCPEDPLEEEIATHSSVAARILVSYSPWGCKESDTSAHICTHTIGILHMISF